MQTQETESAGRSAAAAAELRRLLKRIIANVEAKSIDQSEWWSTGLDTLTEQMRPLWSQIGIKRPGLYVQLRKRRITDPQAESPETWFKDFITHDPDYDSERRLSLACGNGVEQWNTTASSLKSLLYVVQAWVDWVDSQQHEPQAKSSVQKVNQDTENDSTECDDDDWDYATSLLIGKTRLIEIACFIKSHRFAVSKETLLANDKAFPNESYASGSVKAQINRINTEWLGKCDFEIIGNERNGFTMSYKGKQK